ncbi:Uu.00g124170.m01.CDS01 [Anthostomella pinea]|uniref:Uu.00g124170.m01.CDS01 n=1 Tax=Anthostomella pinea TaxID=933095 RepID=A0AAI8YF57_9PEZI|nr:Uu.00g124170.m01.CDS01 [Anthostomella pinea]
MRAFDNGLGVNGFAGDDSLSPLGSLHAPYLPKCIMESTDTECPWGAFDVTNTNQLTTRPETNVTRYYDFNITRETVAPDGVEVQLLLVNGEFPGPLMEANWGDWLEVTVHNNIPEEGSTLHMHGILQQETPWMDGVPGISQCPIAPYGTFTYRFKPDLYGASWWHSHWEGQYVSGMSGPLVVYGPTHVDYDIDVGPVFVTDYFHDYYTSIAAGFMENVIDVTLSDNNLINGKNSYDSNGAPLAAFNFQSGKVHRLRLVNGAAFAVEKISIDGLNMSVIANDFVPIVPYSTDVVTLSPGQRTDVLVQATDDSTDSRWLRVYKPPNCSPGKEGSYLALAAIFNEGADRTKAPTTEAGPNAYSAYCGNDPLSLTAPALTLTPPEPDVTEILPIELRPNGTSNLWYMANRTFRVDYNDPMLLNAKKGDLDFPHIQNVHDYGSNASLRFIIQNTGFQPHPMHLHGHNFWVLQEGACTDNETVFPRGQGRHGDGEIGHMRSPSQMSNLFGGRHHHHKLELAVTPVEEHMVRRSDGLNFGSSDYGSCWDGSIVNPTNPQRRDVQMLLPGSYIVIQWMQDNPGLWPLHCHIAWHLTAGFNWMILERPDDIISGMPIPDAVAQTCTDWNAWTSNHIVEQTGAGL